MASNTPPLCRQVWQEGILVEDLKQKAWETGNGEDRIVDVEGADSSNTSISVF